MRLTLQQACAREAFLNWIEAVNDILLDLYGCWTDGSNFFDKWTDEQDQGAWDWRTPFTNATSPADAVHAWAKQNVKWL